MITREALDKKRDEFISGYNIDNHRTMAFISWNAAVEILWPELGIQAEIINKLENALKKYSDILWSTEYIYQGENMACYNVVDDINLPSVAANTLSEVRALKEKIK